MNLLRLLILAISLTFNLVFIECQSYYKVCQSATVTNIAEAKALKGCVFIDGFLEIKDFNRPSSMLALEQYLSSIEEIDGFLKISGCDEIWSLKFLRNLKKINGVQLESNKYSFILLKNQNLLTLFSNNQTVKIARGEVYVHYNSRLCYFNYIKSILDIENSWSEDEVQTTMLTNGFARKCNSTLANWPVHVQKTSASTAELLWERVSYDKDVNETYIIYYKLLAEIEDHLIAHWWYEQEFNQTDYKSFIPNNVSLVLKNLMPNSKYACYVKASFSRLGLKDDRSQYIYFKTKPARPGRVQNLKLSSHSSSEIVSLLKFC